MQQPPYSSGPPPGPNPAERRAPTMVLRRIEDPPVEATRNRRLVTVVIALVALVGVGVVAWLVLRARGLL